LPGMTPLGIKPQRRLLSPRSKSEDSKP
jgi:hypothetical protein